MALRTFLLVLGTGLSAAVGAADAGDWAQLRWRSIGPFRGGRVLAVAGVPREPQHYYFGAVNGGVWESRDAGRTWQPIFDGMSVGSIGALALAPSDPKTIYVGTGESDMRSDIAQGDGMYVSTDAGAHWKHIGLDDSQQIVRILVHPTDAKLVYVAALGHPYGPNAQRGVFRSRDGGATWQKLLGPDANTGAVDLAFEPGNPQVIYAALWQTRRTPWSVYPPSNGPGSGVYKTTDGGEHWTKLADGLPAKHGRVGFGISAAAPQRVYATVDAEPGGGVYRSDDAGAHWKKMTGDNRVWQRGWYFGELTVDPKNPDRVYAPNTIVLRSDDGGANFVPIRGDITGDDFHTLWIDPENPERQMLGVDQGAIVTLNGGRTWSSWLNQPTAQFYHVATDTRFPYYVYGAQQDSGAAGVPSRTTHGDGINLTQFRETTAGGESDNIAPDPDDPDVIYGGRVDRLDLRTRQTRSIPPSLAFPERQRTTWTLPLAFSRRDPKVLYFAHQNLYRTADQGEHWQRISPDLTRPDPGTPPNLDPTTADLNLKTGPRRGVIYAIAPSRTADRDLWVGTDDGLVWRTQDEGAHWSDITPKALTPWSKVGIVETSTHDAQTAYLAVDRHRLDDFAPYVYRTHDGGKHWDLIVAGIAPRHTVNVVREDPVRRGLLYAGTERGVYVSFDDGAAWQPLQQGLPATSVRDLEVKGNDLVIATHGRGFYVLDDVSPLRQAGAATGTRLLAPAAAIRVRPEAFSGTPMPKEEPMAANPPFGAYVDYVLAAAANQPVTLTIRDSSGKLVRRYSSADVPKAPDPKTLKTAPEWVVTPSVLLPTAGAHRFVWPLRYATVPELAEGDAYADGAWAPPGQYTLELGVDGKTYTQTLTVQPDPRVKLDAAAYAAQFALARRIEADRARLASASTAAGKLQEALTARLAQATSAELKLLRPFQDRLIAVTGSVPVSNPSNGWWLPPASLTSLRHVGGRFEALAHAVDDADAAPSPDAQAGTTQAEEQLPEVIAAWETLRDRDWPALNAALEKQHLAPLKAAEDAKAATP